MVAAVSPAAATPMMRALNFSCRAKWNYFNSLAGSAKKTRQRSLPFATFFICLF
jgi:hypothetical protein